MTEKSLSIPLYKLALLQAYLYEMFTLEHKCELSLKHTQWYLSQKFLPEEIDVFMSFLKDRDLKCDCDILRKLDLRTLNESNFSFH